MQPFEKAENLFGISHLESDAVILHVKNPFVSLMDRADFYPGRAWASVFDRIRYQVLK